MWGSCYIIFQYSFQYGHKLLSTWLNNPPQSPDTDSHHTYTCQQKGFVTTITRLLNITILQPGQSPEPDASLSSRTEDGTKAWQTRARQSDDEKRSRTRGGRRWSATDRPHTHFTDLDRFRAQRWKVRQELDSCRLDHNRTWPAVLKIHLDKC